MHTYLLDTVDLTWKGWQFDIACLLAFIVLYPLVAPRFLSWLERHFAADYDPEEVSAWARETNARMERAVETNDRAPW